MYRQHRFVGFCMAAVLLLAACSPAATPAPHHSMPNDETGTGTTSSSPPLPVIKVAKPWRSGQFQNGIQLYWHTNGTTEQLQTAAARTLNYAVGLGANSVGISFPIYTDGEFPSKVYAGAETPTATSLGIILGAAKARKLRVMLRPIIDETNIPTNSHPEYWRGSLRPVDTDVWFQSYDRLFASYATLAAHYGVQEFVAGTELFSLQAQTAQWRRLKARLMQYGYRGSISYAVNWNDQSYVPFKSLGLDAYPALELGDNASVLQLSAGFQNWFDQQPTSIRSRLTIQEAGIPAETGMYPHPWYHGTYSKPTTKGLTIQDRWFNAMCTAAKASKTQGVYYWVVDSNAEPSLGSAIVQPTSGWIGRPAENSIKRCFSS